MSKRKYAVICSLILTLICCSFSGFAASKEGPPVTMEVSSIYGKIGKMGAHVPVSVTLYGQSVTAFEGELVVQTLENAAESGTEIYEYVYPVSVASGVTEKMEVYVPLGQRSNELHVVLQDTSGKTVEKKTLQFDVSRDSGRLLIGALSDRPEEIRYFDGVSLDYGVVQSQMIVLDDTIFPSDVRGLELFDVMVINRYETDRLSDDQIAALCQWVENGGTLLFGTGAMAYNTLGPLAEELVELPISGVFYETISLGTEYAERAPGDADIQMICAELVIPDGHVVEESDGLSLLTVVDRGEGQIGIYCYDLGNIAEFVEKNPSYVNTMLTDILDESTISNLFYYSSFGSDEEYWNAYSLVNTGNTERLPNLGVYAVVIGIYVVLVGPGLYLFLKKRDLRRLYSVSVMITSLAIAAVVYLLGIGTRFTSQFFTVASIMELEGKTVKEMSYVNVRTPDNRPFHVSVPGGYSVTPLTRTSRFDEQPVGNFKEADGSVVELKFGETGTALSAKQNQAFEPRFFKLTSETHMDSLSGTSGSLVWEDGKVTGTLVNHFPFDLEQAALMFYGQMYLIGDMKAGEVREFLDEPLLVWPVSMSYMVAAQITDEELMKGIYSFYISEQFSQSKPGAYLIGIGPEGGISSVDSFARQTANSMVLYASDVKIAPGQDEMIYRSGLSNRPKVNSGISTVYGDGFTMYGTEPHVVEYFLGTDMEVEKLSFMPVSEVFLENPGYYYVKRFEGAAYFYNYRTKSYDRMNLDQIDFGIEELRPYLSLDGSIIVKYTGEEMDSAGVSWLLPHLMVTGREN